MRRWRPLAAVLAAGAIMLAGVSAPAVQADRIAPQAAPVAEATAYAIVGTIPLPGANPTVNSLTISNDDTVYAPTIDARYVGIINPGRVSGTLDDSFTVSDRAYTAVVSSDDTLFLLQGPGGLNPEISAYRPDLSFDDSVAAGGQYYGLAISRDDTIAGTLSSTSAFFFGGRALTAGPITATSSSTRGGAFDSQGRFFLGLAGGNVVRIGADGLAVDDTISTGGLPLNVAIDDDTKYVSNYTLNQVQVIGPNASSVAYSIAVGSGPNQISVTPDSSVVVVNGLSRTLSLIRRNATVAETIITGFIDQPRGLAIASTGIVYVSIASATNPAIDVVAPVSASLAASVAPAGALVNVDLTGLPAGSIADDSAVVDVWWGDDTVSFTPDTGLNSVSLTVPPGSGSVPVVLQLRGGNAVTAGTFTYGSPTPPAPVPAGPPRDVVAVAGDRSASVSWAAPESSGSFAVTNYQVTASPGGRACLTSGLSCTVAGLTNGTLYSFTVKALTGAGWGSLSAPSNAVTPQAEAKPTVTITGSRDGRKVVISGTSTGLGMGAILKPWLRRAGESTFTQKKAEILVSMDGTFTWQVNARKRVSVYVKTPDGARSNTVRIRSRA